MNTWTAFACGLIGMTGAAAFVGLPWGALAATALAAAGMGLAETIDRLRR